MDNAGKNAYRILIVDDEEIVHQTLKRLLTACGYLIDSAFGGEEGLGMLLTDTYDLVICDIRMPGMNGIDLLAEVKKRRLPIKVIMLTGYASLESAVEAVNLGASGYFLKPLDDIEAFRKKVSEAVREARRTF